MYLVQQPDPNQPKPEGQQMSPLEGEHLGMVNKWPPSLPAALQRWGTTQPKSPCLTALDNAGKPIYTLTYGRYQPVDENNITSCFPFFVGFSVQIIDKEVCLYIPSFVTFCYSQPLCVCMLICMSGVVKSNEIFDTVCSSL